MARQHARPLLIPYGSKETHILTPVALTGDGDERISEAELRDLIFAYPALLPIAEIDRQFENPVAVCTELPTDSGAVDVFLVTPTGLPILVECKLWRNPQARREVIGQILDYAKDLRNWTVSDVQRKVAQRLKRPVTSVSDLLNEQYPSIDEIDFNDALTQNLKKGRFLLLIVGDGIRQGMASIAEYVQDHAGLHFTLGLVEMPLFLCPNGDRLVMPRVLARTETLLRTVIEVPPGMTVLEGADAYDGADYEGEVVDTPQRRKNRERRQGIRHRFWSDFLGGLNLDDPEQPRPSPSRGGNLAFKFGAPGGTSWLTVYRDARNNEVGVFLSSNRNSVGEQASRLLGQYEDQIRRELGTGSIVDFSSDRPVISDRLIVDDLDSDEGRARTLSWLQQRTNDFINALRPRLRAILADLEKE